MYAKKEMEKRTEVKKESKSMQIFIRSFKKGSKKFRTVLTHNPNRHQYRTNLRTVNTFCVLTDTQVPDPDHLGKILGLWNRSFLQNEVREFLFKEHNNCLALNNRTAHFLATVNDKCSFCTAFQDPSTRERPKLENDFLVRRRRHYRVYGPNANF